MLPLEGIRILDLSRMTPGTMCTMMLADLGAEVIKVEAPAAAVSRPAGSGMSPTSPEQERNAALYAPNRNKKSIALNLKMAEAQQVFYKLAEKADVVFEMFRPGVTVRLGIDYATLSKINPRIIYCAITGYGQDGPYRDLPGHDNNYCAIGGVLSMVGPKGGPPAMPMNIIADYAAATLMGIIGILTAVIARQKTGRGQFVDISMTDGVVSLLTPAASQYFLTGYMPIMGEDRLNGGAPYYNVYKTKDGRYISIGCIEIYFWENLCKLLNREDLIPHQLNREKFPEMFEFLQKTMLTKTADEWFELMCQKDITAAKVCTLEETLKDPQILHRQMVVEVDHPRVGKVKQVGIPIKLSDTPGKIRSTSPFMGQHTSDLLKQAGYTDKDIQELKKKGAVT